MEKEMKVGQEVAYNTSRNYFSSAFIRFGKIAKVTKTGIVVLENGYRFNKYGDELKSKANEFPRAYLVEVNHAKARLETDRRNSKVRQKLNELQAKLDGKRPNNYTDEQLVKIDELIAIL